MSASADVLAQAKVEIDLNQIPEGKNVSNSVTNMSGRMLKKYRSSSSGVASLCSFDTELQMRSRMLKVSR